MRVDAIDIFRLAAGSPQAVIAADPAAATDALQADDAVAILKAGNRAKIGAGIAGNGTQRNQRRCVRRFF